MAYGCPRSNGQPDYYGARGKPPEHRFDGLASLRVNEPSTAPYSIGLPAWQARDSVAEWYGRAAPPQVNSVIGNEGILSVELAGRDHWEVFKDENGEPMAFLGGDMLPVKQKDARPAQIGAIFFRKPARL